MMLTNTYKSILKLIMRSKDSGEGYRKCSPVIFKYISENMHDSLIEKDIDKKLVRLTNEGNIVFKWLM